MVPDVRMNPTVKDLRLAIVGGHIEAAFQPLVDIDQSVAVGFEVLARWTHPELGAISPLVFIRMAEENGLIGDLTRQVIARACSHALKFPTVPLLAFNISPVQLRDLQLAEAMAGWFRQAGYPFDKVDIEITESAIIDDQLLGLEVVRQLKALGFGISLDDFGTGYSSLTRLHAFPFTKIKIDASFVRNMEADRQSRRIVASVIGLGQSLGMTVVAEGVETEGQLNMLRGLGCDIGQGYLFGRPQIGLDPTVGSVLPLGSYRPFHSALSPHQRLHQLETLYQNSVSALAFIGTDGRFIRVNERFCTIAGKERTELVGQFAMELFVPKHRRRLERLIEGILHGRHFSQRELTIRATRCTYLVSSSRIVDEGGEVIGISLNMMDVTRRKQAEATLKADEEHFRKAIELSPHVAWAARPTGEIYYMSHTLCRGRSASVEERIEDWYGRLHEEDRSRLRQQWLDWLPSGLPFTAEFRMRWTDGSWRWVRSEARPSRNVQGEIEAWYGMISDLGKQ